MPRPILYVLLLLVALSLVPMGMVYKSRHSPKSQPRIQVVYDMDDQVKFKTQTTNPFFTDGMSMRHLPAGTVPRGQLEADEPFYDGRVAGDTLFVTAFPVEVSRELMYRGRERYEIHCAPCHGQSGNGNGLVHVRAQALAVGTWTPPTDLTSQTVVERPVGHIYNTIRNGIRNMPAYGPQITPEDRWAITAYVRALQLSRNASIEDVPAEARAALEK
jgi:mono/diheme cytochrome c family protein